MVLEPLAQQEHVFMEPELQTVQEPVVELQAVQEPVVEL